VKKLWRRHKKTVYGTVAFASFLLVLGSAGAMENNAISFWQGAWQSLFFTASLVLFTHLAGGFEERGSSQKGGFVKW